MHVNVLVECRGSHAYPSVTREKIIKIAKDMQNGISSVTYRRGELVTRQWCGWDLRTTHRERKRKEEQNRGDRKKKWKSEMNDGGNLGFPAMTFEVGGGGGRGHEGRQRGRSSRTANAWSSWPKHLQVTSVGRKCNRTPLADWFIWRLSQQQQQQQWQQHTQRGFLAWQVFMQYENLVKK